MFVDALAHGPFWSAVLAMYLMLKLDVARSRTLVFGLANLAAMAWVFGLVVSGLALLLAVVTHAGLYIAAGWQGGRPKGRRRFVPWAMAALAAAIYLAYKTSLDHRGWVLAILPVGAENITRVMAPLTALALSFVVLRVWTAARSVIVDGDRLLNPVSLSGYLTPFFMLGAGPINSYSEHLAIDDLPYPAPERLPRLVMAFDLIATGLFYKFVVARTLQMFAAGINGSLPLESWGDNAWFLIYTFFDFAGYSLVAFGIGKLIGIPTPLNFDRPFQARTVTEFWQRWHISLGDFVRVQIFLPLQIALIRRFGVRYAYWSGALSLCVAFGFVGLWHRLTWQFLLWGVALAILMVAEKKVLETLAVHAQGWISDSWRERLAVALGPAYVFASISLSYLLVARQMAPK